MAKKKATAANTYHPEHTAAGTNGWNDEIYLFEANGKWWVENHTTGWVSEDRDAEAGAELFEAACASNHFNEYRY